MGKILRLEEVPLNAPLADSLYDRDGVLLMRRGSIITTAQLKALALKGLRYLELGAPATDGDANVALMEPPADGSSLDNEIEQWGVAETGKLKPSRESSSLSRSMGKKSIRLIDQSTTDRVNQLVIRASETVEELGRSLADGTLRDATPIRNIANEFLKELQGDSDQAVAAVLNQVADQQLATRSVQLSVLSIAIARAMKLTDSEQSTVGSAALLHDMALFELPENERHSQLTMRPEARRIYESHPAIAYDMLERVRDIDGTVRIIVLQAHEQADGSGFPRRIAMARTHRLARIVNLADAYLTLTGGSPGDQNLLPADTIAYLMHHSCLGRFDSTATCGLVRAVSLYPLGSLVKLSDERTARVVRVAAQKPVTPIVMPNEGDRSLIDLSDSELLIAEPIDDGLRGRRRLPAGDLDKVLW